VIRPAPFPRAAVWLPSIAVAACFLSVGCDHRHDDNSVKPSPIEALATRELPRDPRAEARSRGRSVFTHYCAICHGDAGKGDGFNSASLEVPPRDFSSAEFWQRSTDERLLLAVSEGGPAVGKSVLMPFWGKTLTGQQLHAVVAYLRTLGPQANLKP
jgi:cytochrome c oxidase cbb3-type subunit III